MHGEHEVMIVFRHFNIQGCKKMHGEHEAMVVFRLKMPLKPIIGA
jgi:hypothetical protein